ncbi:phenylacetate--CoA ligase family protein [Ruminococcus sp. OA3]|uniref:DVU_1553 family AMP-dependent CoA ligase n=1 Tax=Ruminococcus sp. OA3 TaxID=2914164 RepID=UPI001F067F4F|nr:phenylacetate--CoA ligase family protein [Ruminococcus sp. OA3]MCH1982579.1 phenylacetate--CoA ligase family protein [Ruminococcus sp. OA3]
MILDDWIRQKHGIETEREGEIRCWQLKRITELIRRAKSESPYYRRLYDDTAVPDSWDAFRCLPFTDASAVREQGLQMLCVPQGEIERVVTLTTTGTSGLPKRLYFTRQDQDLTIDFFYHGMALVARPGGVTVVFLPYERVGSVGDLLLKGLTRMHTKGIGYGLITELEDAVNVLMTNRADSFVAAPVQALALACYVREHGIRLFLHKILLSTDHLSGSVKKRLEADLQCEVYDHFGITEAGLGAAIDCPAHCGMHIRENDLLFEVIHPESAEILPDGCSGELVLTTLTREGMPLIRYRTGDYGKIERKRCSCGSFLTRLWASGGRIGNEIRHRDGMLTMEDLDELLFAAEGLMDYRAGYQYADNLLKLHLVFYAKLPGNMTEFIEMIQKVIREQTGLKTEITAEPSMEIRPQYLQKRTILRDGENE